MFKEIQRKLDNPLEPYVHLIEPHFGKVFYLGNKNRERTIFELSIKEKLDNKNWLTETHTITFTDTGHIKDKHSQIYGEWSGNQISWY